MSPNQNKGVDMYIIRNVFQTKPGKAKELVRLFKESSRYMQGDGIGKTRLLTDVSANFWTVILEMEVRNLATYEQMADYSTRPEVREIMKDYMTLVEGGYREIFKVEE